MGADLYLVQILVKEKGGHSKRIYIWLVTRMYVIDPFFVYKVKNFGH